jgi:hypothetical protein
MNYALLVAAVLGLVLLQYSLTTRRRQVGPIEVQPGGASVTLVPAAALGLAGWGIWSAL